MCGIDEGVYDVNVEVWGDGGDVYGVGVCGIDVGACDVDAEAYGGGNDVDWLQALHLASGIA